MLYDLHLFSKFVTMEVETGILFVNACLIIQTNVLDSLESRDLSIMGYGFSNMDKDLFKL